MYIVIGIVIGAGACWLYLRQTAAEPFANVEVERIQKLIDGAHYAAFGPLGMTPESQDAAFNAVWKWADVGQNGCPR